jgi:hypothetical protein
MTVIQPLGWQQAHTLQHLAQSALATNTLHGFALPKCWSPGLSLPYWLSAYAPKALALTLPKGFYIAPTKALPLEPLALVTLRPDASGLQRYYLSHLCWQNRTQGLEALSQLLGFLTNTEPGKAPHASPLLVWVPVLHQQTLEPLLQASGFCKVGKQTTVTLHPQLLKKNRSLLLTEMKALPSGWETAHWRHRSQLDALAWDSLPVPFRPWLFPVPEGFYLSPWKQWSSRQAGWFIKRWVHHSSNGLDASFELRTQDFSSFNLQVQVSPYYPSLATEALLGALQQSLKMAQAPNVYWRLLNHHPALEQALTEGLGCSLESGEESHLWVFGSRTVTTPSHEPGSRVLPSLGYGSIPIHGGATSV